MSKRGVLLDADKLVMDWAFKTHNLVPIHMDRAIGIVEDGKLVGAAMFSSYNTVNANFSYYGKATLTRGIVRVLAKIALYELKLSRCTIIVPKRPAFLLKKVHKLNFKYEGVQRRYYGPTDKDQHKGCRFVAFREDLLRLAGLQAEVMENVS